jgi:hypothetical protein
MRYRIAALSLRAGLLFGLALGAYQLPARVWPPRPFVLALGPATQLRGSRVGWPCEVFPAPECDRTFYAVDLIWADRTGYRVVTFVQFRLK